MPGATLLGDAAHLMAPNGEGGNIVMFDGAEFIKAIATDPSNVEAALGDYKKGLFLRGASAASDGTEEVFDKLLGPDSPQSLVDFFTSHRTAE